MRIEISPTKMDILYDKEACMFYMSFKDMNNEIWVTLNIDPFRFYKIQEKILCAREDTVTEWDFSELDEMIVGGKQ